MIASEGRVAPHADPELKRKPQCYAKLVRDLSLRGLVSSGALSEATVGVFVVPKKLGKQRLIFDTRHVNQHFRRPWHCVLPTPASWAGLQLPIYSAYHMADCQVCPLKCSFVKRLRFQIICDFCPTSLRNFMSLQWVSWALYFCQKMVENCVRAAGFSADAPPMDRHRAPAMTRGSICFGVHVDGVCAVGCDRPKVHASMEAVRRLWMLLACIVLRLRLRLIHPGKFSLIQHPHGCVCREEIPSRRSIVIEPREPLIHKNQTPRFCRWDPKKLSPNSALPGTELLLGHRDTT